MRGRIIQVISNQYKIQNEQKEIFEAALRGVFRKEEITPVVGDMVEVEITDQEKKQAIIEKIEKRSVYSKRPKLANITKLILVVASKDPKPDLVMLDKQLAFAQFLGIDCIIVFNKIDLDSKQELKEIKRIYEEIGYLVIETQANSQKGIKQLKEQLKGNINAFSGNSGVGKSTLINGIFEKEITQEGQISQKNKRGKNTTTTTSLYEIEKDTYIADTPGFSTFSIEEIPSKELARYFKEFKKEIQNCEFVGCTHIKETNCGIKRAIEEGRIEKARYERFCKIYQELKTKEERKKW